MVKRKGRKVVVKMKGLPPIKLRPKRPLPDGKALKSLRIVRRVTGVSVDLVYEVDKHPFLKQKPPLASTWASASA